MAPVLRGTGLHYADCRQHVEHHGASVRGIDLVIEPDFSLAETAELISSALGVSFSAERTGRYEEFPAFTAHQAGVEYALLGPPAPEDDIRDDKTIDYCLSVIPWKDSSESATAAELLLALRAAGLRVE